MLFTEGIPEITEDNLLDYYIYLKRKYINKLKIENIKEYFVEFFCKFINEHNINYEFDSFHELSIYILSSIHLKRINLLLNLNNYKSSYKSDKITDINKKPFLRLFQTIFEDKNISKISEIHIISQNEKGENIEIDSSDLIIKILIEKINNFKPKIKYKIFELYNELSENEGKILKLWKLIIPYEKNIFIQIK